MANKFMKRNTSNGNIQEELTVNVSAGVSSAAKIPELDANGKLDQSMMPSGVGPDTQAVTASEVLSAGDFVNVYNNAGNLRIRKADASANKPAHGFVKAAVASSASGVVYFEGQNDQLSSLTLGSDYFLSDTTPGGVTATPVTGVGKLHQYLGKAITTTLMATEIETPIELAS